MRAGTRTWSPHRWGLLLLSVVALSRGIVYLLAAFSSAPMPPGMRALIAAFPWSAGGVLLGVSWLLIGGAGLSAALRGRRGDTPLVLMTGLWIGGTIGYLGSTLFLHARGDWAFAVICAVFAGVTEVFRRDRSQLVTLEFVESRLRVEADGGLKYLHRGAWVAVHPERL